MIPYIQNSPPSKILDTFENILDSFETTPNLFTQTNLIANDAGINSNETDQSESFSDKIFEQNSISSKIQ